MAEPIETPEAPQAPSLVRDGDRVAVRGRDGAISMVDNADLQGAISEGYTPATEGEWERERLGTSGRIAARAVGVGQGLSFGNAAPALIEGAKALGADDAAETVRRGVEIAQRATPNEYLQGEVVGALAPMAFGAPAAVAGEEIVGGALARAGTRALRAAPRAIAEGAAIGVGHQATEDTIHNKPFAAEAYGTAAFKGGLLGLLIGSGGAATLGAAGDRLAPLFGRGARGAEDAAVTAESAVEGTAVREGGRVSIDPDAGLFEKAERAESPFVFGPKNRSVSLDTNAMESQFASTEAGLPVVSTRRSVSLDPSAIDATAADVGAGPIGRRVYVGAEPEAGSPAARDWWLSGKGLPPAKEEPFDVFKIGKPGRVRESDAAFGEAVGPVRMVRPGEIGPGTHIPSEAAPFEFRLGVDPDAGLRAERGAEAQAFRIGESGHQPFINPEAGIEDSLVSGKNAFRISRSKDAPRSVGLGDIEPTEPILGRRGIRIEAPPPAAVEAQAAAQGQRGASEWLAAQADRQAFKATGAKAGDIRRLADSVEAQQAEMERIGSRLRNESVRGKPLVEATASQAEIAKRITERADEVGKELSVMRSGLNKAAARPSMDEVVQRFEEYAGPIEKMPMGEADTAAARKYLEEMVEKGGARPDFNTLYQYRRRLDDKLRKNYVRVTPIVISWFAAS